MSDELVAERRRKLAALRDEGLEPFPHSFAGVRPISAVKAPFGELPAVRRRRFGRAWRGGWPRGGARGRLPFWISSTGPGASSSMHAPMSWAANPSTASYHSIWAT